MRLLARVEGGGPFELASGSIDLHALLLQDLEPTASAASEQRKAPPPLQVLDVRLIGAASAEQIGVLSLALRVSACLSSAAAAYGSGNRL